MNSLRLRDAIHILKRNNPWLPDLLFPLGNQYCPEVPPVRSNSIGIRGNARLKQRSARLRFSSTAHRISRRTRLLETGTISPPRLTLPSLMSRLTQRVYLHSGLPKPSVPYDFMRRSIWQSQFSETRGLKPESFTQALETVCQIRVSPQPGASCTSKLDRRALTRP